MKNGLINAGVLLFVVIGIPWIVIESIPMASNSRISLRAGIVLGLFCLPVLVWIYHQSFSGSFSRALLGMGFSFAFKTGTIVGSAWIVHEFFTFSLYYYIPALFFSLFSITFIAIYFVCKVGTQTGTEIRNPS